MEMAMKIDFSTSNRIIFGSGELNNIADLIKDWGHRAFIIRGKNPTYGKAFFEILEGLDLEITYFKVDQEPDIELVVSAVQQARGNKCEFVIGLGGGSVIDTGKAVASLLNNDGELMDYLEVVGKGLPQKNLSKPYIAIPSTAGTGSEVTRNAVIDVPDKKVKVSMRNAYMLPEIALVDPELTLDLPPNITASTGMDAFVQVIEPYVCNSPNPMVDMFCRDAIPRAAKNLLSAYQDGSNIKTRENMAWVSLMGGLSLANAKLGAVHGFAGPIGGMFHAHHGAICACLLPAVMRVNIENLKKADPESFSLKRYREIAVWLTDDLKADVDDGILFIGNICKNLKIPRLNEIGISEKDFPSIVEKSKNSSSMKGNPIQLPDEELIRILELSY
jgi:alcohol dehydrogenase class IV